MSKYSFSLKIKTIIISIIFVFFVAFYVYLNYLTSDLSKSESEGVDIWCNAVIELYNSNKEGKPNAFALKIVGQNSTIPMILVDASDNILEFNNINPKILNSKEALFNQKLLLSKDFPPKEILLSSGSKVYLYHSESSKLKMVRYLFYAEGFVFALSFILWYIALNYIKKHDENRTWVALTKETAHQLGTPISSLIGWIEYLRSKENIPKDVLKIYTELENDTMRISQVADRFSKVGSKPKLTEINITTLITDTVSYFKPRLPENVKITVENPYQEILVMGNTTLLCWCFENIIKNSLDSLKGKGIISITVKVTNVETIIFLKDNGSGISSIRRSDLFKAGFTTKERGWGLGLSLVKRVVTSIHKGKVYLAESVPFEKTTFKIHIPLKGSLKS